MDTAPHVVMQLADSVGVACEGYYDLPVVLPAYIAVVTDDSRVATREAVRLRAELRRQLLSLAGARLETRRIPCGPCPAHRKNFDCTALNRALSQNVLVFVGDGTSGPSSRFPVVPAPRNSTVLVLLPSGAAVPNVPWSHSTNNVGYWTASATEFVPRILAAAGLTDPDARIFISYRRSESSEVVEQLFEELSKRNFDVFVDRFRIEAGADFQQRILQELAHKSMALFVESAGILDSQWTRYEVAVAKSSRIGVAALQLPGGRSIPDIDESRRMRVPLTNGTIASSHLSDVIEWLMTEHSLSQLRRRLLFRQSMQRALMRVGVHRQSVVDGIVEVEPNAGSSKRYLVWLPSRPAELSDFHSVATAAAIPSPTRSIVAPAAHLVGNEQNRLRWLAGVADVRSFDESEMLRVAAAMKQESL